MSKVSYVPNCRVKPRKFIVVNEELPEEHVVQEKRGRKSSKPLPTEVHSVPILPPNLPLCCCPIAFIFFILCWRVL